MNENEIELAHSKGYKADFEQLTRRERFAVVEVENRIRFAEVDATNHPEKLEGTKIDLWSYRANNQGIRVIVFKWNPREWILVACGHHETVYRKANNLRSKPVPGEKLPQIVVEEVHENIVRTVVETVQPTTTTEPGFTGFTETDFSDLGVPKSLIAALMTVRSADELLEFLQEKEDVPEDVKDCLMVLYSKPERLNEIKREKSDQKLRLPLKLALEESPIAREQFVILSDDDLEKFYSGKLDNWQVFLHHSQRQVVEMKADGPILVTGPAGTGKSVVAVHRACWLLRNVFTGQERILLTTFGRALALASRKWLETICTPEEMARVDVVNFDTILREWFGHISDRSISYPTTLPDILDSDRSIRSPEFLCNEFLKVILEYNITSLNEYRQFTRPRNCGILRDQARKYLWPIFKKGKKRLLDSDDNSVPKVFAVNMLTSCFLRNDSRLPRCYSCIIIDEAQDFGASEYRLFAAYTRNTYDRPVPNSLFLAGDGRQRVYRRSGTLKDNNINVTGARSRRLTKCYRSTGKIREFAERLIADIRIDDMDGETDAIRGGESLIDGVPPEERFFATFDTMVKDIRNTILRWSKHDPAHELNEWGDYAVLVRRNKMAKDITDALNAAGLPALQVDHNTEVLPHDAVNVITMHRAKGLQFRGVVVCLDEWPSDKDEIGDIDIDEEKSLLYVSIMRAQTSVLLTGSTGARPRLLP